MADYWWRRGGDAGGAGGDGDIDDGSLVVRV